MYRDDILKTARLELLAFLIVGAFFILGAVFGFLFTEGFDSPFELSFYDRDFLGLFFDRFRFPLLALILGYFVFGFVLLPVLGFACGFSVSFSVSQLVLGGNFAAYVLYAASEVVTVVAFFSAVRYAFPSSCSLFGASFFQSHAPLTMRSGQLIRLLALAAALLAFSFAESAILAYIQAN